MYRYLFATYGRDSLIFGRITVFTPNKIYFGTNSTLNEGVILNARGGIEIGNNVHISPNVIINSGTLDYKNKQENRFHEESRVVIQDGVWLASGVIINPGVTIGKNSVIGAGSVVTNNVPDDEVWVGVPARFLKKI